jgi:hypothetical protein
MAKGRLAPMIIRIIVIFLILLAIPFLPYYILYGPQPPAYPINTVNALFEESSAREVQFEFDTYVIFPYTQMKVDLEITEANEPFLVYGSYMDILNSTGGQVTRIPFTPETGFLSTDWFCAQGHYTIILRSTSNWIAQLEGRIIVTIRGWPYVGWWVCPP